MNFKNLTKFLKHFEVLTQLANISHFFMKCVIRKQKVVQKMQNLEVSVHFVQ